MPFLPFVLLLVWQVIGRSASFALGWATALYFGQVPGKQGHVLALISLVSAGWVLLLAGFGVPLLVGAAADALGVVPRNFDLDRWIVLGLGAALVLAPPLLAALATGFDLKEDRSLGRWLSRVPVSYPATASLGFGVLEMVAFIALPHRRPAAAQAGAGPDGPDHEGGQCQGRLAGGGCRRVARHGREPPAGRRGPRLPGLAAAHGRLRGHPPARRGGPRRPAYLAADDLTIYAYATNVSIIGPAAKAHLARASLEREVPFHGAHLTWQEDSQRLEDELLEAGRGGHGIAAVRRRLDRIQQRIDAAPLAVDEWNLLYRLRLQVEQRSDEAEQHHQARASA